MGLAIFGSRQLLVKVKGEEGCISLAQRPGSFCVGNLCALEHNVANGASAPGSYGPPENQVQITVMLRKVRARKTDACIFIFIIIIICIFIFVCSHLCSKLSCFKAMCVLPPRRLARLHQPWPPPRATGAMTRSRLT